MLSKLQWIAVLLLVLALIGGGFWLGSRIRGGRDAKELEQAKAATAELLAHGYHEGEVTKPKIEDLPKGAEAVAVAKGSLGFTVHRGAPSRTDAHQPAPGAELLAPAGDSPPTAGTSPLSAPDALSWPSPGDLAVRSETRLVKVQGKPFAQVWLSCDLQGQEGGVLVTRGPELADEISLQVAPVAVQTAARWHGEIRLGVNDAPGWEAGGTLYGRSRFGGWVNAGAGRAAAGVALRLGR
jgi:hypothetical protein